MLSHTLNRSSRLAILLSAWWSRLEGILSFSLGTKPIRRKLEVPVQQNTAWDALNVCRANRCPCWMDVANVWRLGRVTIQKLHHEFQSLATYVIKITEVSTISYWQPLNDIHLWYISRRISSHFLNLVLSVKFPRHSKNEFKHTTTRRVHYSFTPITLPLHRIHHQLIHINPSTSKNSPSPPRLRKRRHHPSLHRNTPSPHLKTVHQEIPRTRRWRRGEGRGELERLYEFLRCGEGIGGGGRCSVEEWYSYVSFLVFHIWNEIVLMRGWI